MQALLGAIHAHWELSCAVGACVAHQLNNLQQRTTGRMLVIHLAAGIPLAPAPEAVSDPGVDWMQEHPLGFGNVVMHKVTAEE